MMRITPKVLGPMIEQPEPSTEGDWYIVDIDALKAEGVRYIGFHFEHEYGDDAAPNDVCGYGEDGE